MSTSTISISANTRNISGHWAKDAIDIAVANGVTSIEFKPNHPISRAQAAVMISNFKDLPMVWSDKFGGLKDLYYMSG